LRHARGATLGRGGLFPKERRLAMLGKTALLAGAAILAGLTLSTVCPAGSLGVVGRHGGIDTTHRRIYGPITELDAKTMTMTVSPDGESAVTGNIDIKRTRITIEGHESSPGELRPGNMARAQLGLDEVWDVVVVDKR
jgi:hypothetical protein